MMVRMFIVVLRGYMWFSESETNLIPYPEKCKYILKNIFHKYIYHCKTINNSSLKRLLFSDESNN